MYKMKLVMMMIYIIFNELKELKEFKAKALVFIYLKLR